MTDTYSIMLPENLPPTFKGKCLKFSYELVIGTCRAASSSPSASVGSAPRSANSVSRIMKVPIRVYNHVVGWCRLLHRDRRRGRLTCDI